MNKKLDPVIKKKSSDKEPLQDPLANFQVLTGKLFHPAPLSLSTRDIIFTSMGVILIIFSFTLINPPDFYPSWIADSLLVFFGSLYGGIFLLFAGQGKTLDRILRPKVASSLAGYVDPSIGKKEIEELRYKLKVDLIKTKVSVTHSSLSYRGKNQCLQLLEEAEVSLATVQTAGELNIIGDLIDTASEIKDSIKKESIIVVLYTVVSLTLLSYLAVKTWTNWDTIAFEQSVFGLPLAVLLWSGVGGFVSVLFRYVFQQEEFQEPTPKWLFIRPVMGIVLGTVTYFAVSIGLFLVDPNITPETLVQDRGLLFIVLAFLSGFSDKFALFILSSVMGRVAPGWSSQAEGNLTEIRTSKRKEKQEQSMSNQAPNGRHPDGKKTKA